MAIVAMEGCLGDFVGVHAHLMVARAMVELSEKTRISKLIQQIVDNRNRGLTVDRVFIHGTLVDKKTARAILLLDKEHR